MAENVNSGLAASKWADFPFKEKKVETGVETSIPSNGGRATSISADPDPKGKGKTVETASEASFSTPSRKMAGPSDGGRAGKWGEKKNKGNGEKTEDEVSPTPTRASRPSLTVSTQGPSLAAKKFEIWRQGDSPIAPPAPTTPVAPIRDTEAFKAVPARFEGEILQSSESGSSVAPADEFLMRMWSIGILSPRMMQDGKDSTNLREADATSAPGPSDSVFKQQPADANIAETCAPDTEAGEPISEPSTKKTVCWRDDVEKVEEKNSLSTPAKNSEPADAKALRKGILKTTKEATERRKRSP